MRLLRYPSQAHAAQGTFGIGAHCDYECFTILGQDQVGGLLVQNSAGEWIDAPPVPGTFVVNIGEMMARWTNDVFLATRHRVINASQRKRWSIPFFFATNYDTLITCLECCKAPDAPAKYQPGPCRGLPGETPQGDLRPLMQLAGLGQLL
jgi:isopenicillin N synthase-like dioxygenase